MLTLSLGAADMVLIKGGKFTMGGEAENAPKHEVEVSSFYMDKTEVTQKDFFAITGENPSRFKGDLLPVERVRWNECIK